MFEKKWSMNKSLRTIATIQMPKHVYDFTDHLFSISCSAGTFTLFAVLANSMRIARIWQRIQNTKYIYILAITLNLFAERMIKTYFKHENYAKITHTVVITNFT